MNMAVLQFYQNKYRYPQYTNTLPTYGSPMDCTPIGVNLKNGTLRVKGSFSDFMSCNYLSLTRDRKTIYAWIDDVRFRTEDSFDVSYSVDAWRTYKNHIELGTQFIKRSPKVTYLRDSLLGSLQPYQEITTHTVRMKNSMNRVFVVQTRTGGGGELFANTPVQPTPYQFYLIEYDINNWQATKPLDQLMTAVTGTAEVRNIVTMYSIPYMDLTGINTAPLIVDQGANKVTIEGFKRLESGTDTNQKLSLETVINFSPVMIPDKQEFMRVDHSVQLVIPEAGIISIPDELLMKDTLTLRQDIDLFSGACNYMLVTGSGKYHLSVRGSSISSIPIVSDPLDTYLSQNQNALATSLIGDVASIAIGAGLMRSGGIASVAGGVGGAGIAGGLNGLFNTASNIGDKATSSYSNPPAFLGTALAGNFNQTFWVVITQTKVTNATDVHSNFGYPYNMIDQLTFPTSGYIQTEGCNVASTDGSVPRWALDEINNLFNGGIIVHPT